MTFLAACGHPLGTDFGWPSLDGRTICYSCFEAEADAEWWEMVQSVPVAVSGDDTMRDAEAPASVHLGPRNQERETTA